MQELEGYHSAGSDARYTSQIMPELDFEKVRKFYSVDTYRIPQNIKEEIYLDLVITENIFQEDLQIVKKLPTTKKLLHAAVSNATKQ